MAILLMGAPLSSLKGVLESRSTESMPFGTSLTAFFNAITWSLYVNMLSGVGYCLMFRYMTVDCSILLLSYSISSGALESPILLLSYTTPTLASHNTIILIITP